MPFHPLSYPSPSPICVPPTIPRKELFESLASLTLPVSIKTALELADRRLQKQQERTDRPKVPEKGKGKRAEKDEDEEPMSSSFQSPTVSIFCVLFIE
jgi:hypothetical protein